jgi:hypothetical protein
MPSCSIYDHEEATATADPGDNDFSPLPIDAPTIIALEREVNVINVQRSDGTSATILGSPAANVYTWQLAAGFVDGWVEIGMPGYDYNIDNRIANLTEAVGGINADAAGLWTGVPAIGFSVTEAAIGPGQAGEAVKLIHRVNRGM